MVTDELRRFWLQTARGDPASCGEITREDFLEGTGCHPDLWPIVLAVPEPLEPTRVVAGQAYYDEAELARRFFVLGAMAAAMVEGQD